MTTASMRHKNDETAKAEVPGEAPPKRRGRMPQEAFSRSRPYPSTPETGPTSPEARPRQVAAYGSGMVASRLSLCPLPPAPTCRPLLHNTQVR